MMGGRKFFVTIVAVISLLSMCLPAYSAIITYGGTVNPSAHNPLNIDGVVWRYDDSFVYDGTDDTLLFEVDFFSGSNLVLSFGNSGAIDPATIIHDTYVKYWSGTFSGDPSVTSATLDIDDFAVGGSVPFYLDGQTTGAVIGLSGTINFTVVPIPGAMWLLGSGLIGLAGLRIRYRKSE